MRKHEIGIFYWIFKVSDEEKKVWDKDETLNEVENLMDKEHYAEAITVIDKVLQKIPNSEAAILLKARCILGEQRRAKDALIKRVVNGKDFTLSNTKIIKMQSIVFKKQIEEGFKLVGKALDINPNSENAKQFNSKDYLYSVSDLVDAIKMKKEELEEAKRQDKRYLCKKCGYGWESRKRFGKPAICPYCKGDFIIKYSSTSEWREEQI